MLSISTLEKEIEKKHSNVLYLSLQRPLRLIWLNITCKMISALRKGVENENFVDNNFSCCVFTVERSSSDCQRDATANTTWFRISSNTAVYLQLVLLLRALLGIGSTNNFFEEQIVFRLCITKADFEFKTPPKLEPSTCLSAHGQVVKVSNHRSTILKTRTWVATNKLWN